jgi:hypothetical protein
VPSQSSVIGCASALLNGKTPRRHYAGVSSGLDGEAHEASVHEVDARRRCGEPGKHDHLFGNCAL